MSSEDIKILYENEMYVVCIKPSGITSEDGRVSGMPSLLGGGKPYFTVHRLDREVSGVMVYAKTKASAAALSRQVANGELLKKYYAVLKGELPKEGRLEDLLFKNSAKNKTFVVKRQRAGVKRAALEYSLLSEAYIGGDAFSLVKIVLLTGRTHQIRVQFASRKHPVFGDRKYGSDITGGFGLFSCYLSFIDPLTKKRIVFEADPPECTPWNSFDFFTENS